MLTLTKEQQQRIEENKRNALELKAKKLAEKQRNNSVGTGPVNNPFSKQYGTPVKLEKETLSFPLKRNNSPDVSLQETYKKLATGNEITPGKTILNFYSKETSMKEHKKPNSAFSNSTSCSIQESSNSFKSQAATPHYSNYGSKSSNTQAPFSVTTGYCKLISKDKFVVDVGYHKRMIDIFKTIKSGTYDVSTKKWAFNIKDHELLMSALNAEKDISIARLPQMILKLFSENPQKGTSENIDLSQIDKTLVESLMPFQREGVCFGISKKGRCLIADDMGLGKTIQALGIAHFYKSDWPLLIVTPSSVRYTWLEAIENWLPSVPLHSIMVMTSGKDFVKDARVLILSYDLLVRQQKAMMSLSYGVVIVDESHFLKNCKTARTKVCLQMIGRARRAILLSGTPALSRPSELYTQIIAIDKKAFPCFQDYGIRYCNGKKNMWGWDFNGSSNMDELQLLLENRFMIRRLKSEVITQLPSKVRHVVILNPSGIRSNSAEMQSWMKTLDSKTLKGMERRGALLQFFAATGRTKLNAILDYLSDLLMSNKKFICFAHHKAVIEGICKMISEKNILYIKIDGSTNSAARKELCDKFQYQEEYAVAVLSITSANAGITLTAAQLVVFAELFWNPGILTQAEDRAHRIGQQDSVLVQYLIAKGTADDHLWPMIQRKLDVLNKAGLSKDNFLHSNTTVVKDKSQPTLEHYFQELGDFNFEEEEELLASVLDHIENV